MPVPFASVGPPGRAEDGGAAPSPRPQLLYPCRQRQYRMLANSWLTRRLLSLSLLATQ